MADQRHHLVRWLTSGRAAASLRPFTNDSCVQEAVMRFLISIVLAAASTIPASLAAQDVRDTTRLRELVVTATRAPTPADAVVSSITVIEGDELRARGFRFVQDALREVP